MVKRATFTEFRNNAAKFFDAIEDGDTVEVYRKGKLSAVVTSPEKVMSKKATFSKSVAIHLPGLELSKALLEERASNKW